MVGEGGTNTTNLQQGLCKCWAQVPGAGTSIFDSFNVGSITDTGTGVIRFTYTSNMVNTRASFTMGHQYTASSGTGSYFTNGGARATSSHDHNHYQNGSLADPVLYNGTVHGDLA